MASLYCYEIIQLVLVSRSNYLNYTHRQIIVYFLRPVPRSFNYKMGTTGERGPFDCYTSVTRNNGSAVNGAGEENVRNNVDY